MSCRLPLSEWRVWAAVGTVVWRHKLAADTHRIRLSFGDDSTPSQKRDLGLPTHVAMAVFRVRVGGEQ